VARIKTEIMRSGIRRGRTYLCLSSQTPPQVPKDNKNSSRQSTQPQNSIPTTMAGQNQT